MKVTRALGRITPPALQDGFRRLSDSRLRRSYVRGGAIPWSPGYEEYKRQLIQRALADNSISDAFRDHEALPGGYGQGVDERCIEYPWLFAQLSPDRETLLDAGSTLNHDYILEQPALSPKTIHILTLAPEPACFWKWAISYLYCDLRQIPIKDSFYDVCVCVSTLEHIGCDNTLYTGDAEHREDRPDDFILVMNELRRVLKPRGQLLLTVPFGFPRHYGTFRQFDRSLLSRAIESSGPWRERSEVFYRYTPEGWSLSNAADCGSCEYVEWVARARKEWPDPVPAEPDRAAAARAVACVRLVR